MACGTVERLLPEGYVSLSATDPAAGRQTANLRRLFPGQRRRNGFPVPREAYYMSGAGGQTTLIVPSHDLVVVRMGHFKGSTPGGASFRRSLALLLEALPQAQ